MITSMDLPPGFVYVHEVDPSIIINMRYITSENFIGKPLVGYQKNVAILSKEAAEALSRVQKAVSKEGYSLVIYDAYRPQKTVNQFVEWGSDHRDDKMKAYYYPRIEKEDIFEFDYVSKRSSHTRGSTVDITLISLENKLTPVKYEKRTLNDGTEILYLNDNTIDMGTSFDLFDKASHPDSDLVAENYRQNREYLQEKMLAQGFTKYDTEWWHFTLNDEPFPETYFNFNVE